MEVDYSALKIPALKLLLAKRGLPVAGRKNELIERLLLSQNQTLTKEPFQESVSINEKGSEDGKENKVITRPDVCASSLTLKSEQTKVGEGTKYTSTNTSNVMNLSTQQIEVPANITHMTDEQRLEFRKQKFGLVSEEDKKIARAKRFNLWTPEVEAEKRKQRAARFGFQSNSSTLVAAGVNPKSVEYIIADLKASIDSEEEERRKARALRFGIVDEATKKQLRMKRFGIVDEEEKKRRRIERFGVV